LKRFAKRGAPAWTGRETRNGTVKVMKRDSNYEGSGLDMGQTSIASEDHAAALDCRLDSVQTTAATQVSHVPCVLLFASSTDAFLKLMESGELECDFVSRKDS